MPSKILYLDWIYGSHAGNAFAHHEASPLQEEIIANVRRAVESLSEEEREFVHLYWFEGRPLPEIEELLGKQPSKLDALNRAVIRKLRSRLAGYVASRFGLRSAQEDCVICNHPQRSRIDQMLVGKPPEETFRRTIATLSRDFNVSVSTPQILVGHMKYHMNTGR